MRNIGIILIVLLLSINTYKVKAQQIGYVDMEEVVLSMPEKQAADSVLDAYSREIYNQMENMQQAYQSELNQFLKDSINLSDVEKEVTQKKLLDEQKRFVDFQQNARERISQKQNSLWQPLLKKARIAMKTVADTKGYEYIVDDFQYPNKIPFIIVKPESSNLTRAVTEQLKMAGK